ncbi:histidine phosphatase family protein [Rhodovibrio salinarum]|uniref:Histidine phosphatase family protein n=1 Tax=Rhodovibrio salinarum TaxID=1087 RepID=A0A934QI47_9PROT|nr:histidine phosphatase family protein [Rhodovibrio salinarum]MBK1697192.1 histidine phosphatase family protein [Rhodovibrio salinarum]
MPRLVVLLALVLLTVPALPVPSQAQEGGDVWAALEAPGTVAIMRHALAPGTGDPSHFKLGDCSTQRDLNAAGRAQARRIGQAFRDNGIEVDRVLTSQWCRCRHTAQELGLASVEDFPALNSFFQNRATRDAQTAAVRDFLATAPDDAKLVLVTHQVNITALTDVFPSSGEVLVVEVADDGTVDVRGSFLIRAPR